MFPISSILSLFNIADTGHCSHAVTLHDYLKVYSSLAPSVTICEWIVDVPNQVELCFFSIPPLQISLQSLLWLQ
jgi:hypothetical protein